ncbi:unnamed protein product [Symbiodinium sp. CCMP2592]|nr:unnamed protein product [Symbiodinium sp. CCMP2592]
MAQCLAELPLKQPFSADARHALAQHWMMPAFFCSAGILLCLSLCALATLWHVRRLSLQVTKLQVTVESLGIPVLLQEPTLFPESVRQEVEKAHKGLWKQLRDTQAMILRIQAVVEDKLHKYEKIVKHLIHALHDLEPMTEKLQDSVTSVFDVLEEIFQEEERVFSCHTAQLIAAMDRLKYIVHQLLDRSEKRYGSAHTLRQDLHKAVISVLNQNHRILTTVDVLPCEIEHRLGQILLKRLREILPETIDPLHQQLQLLATRESRDVPSSSHVQESELEPHEPSVPDNVSLGPSAHFVTLDDGSTLPVQLEA